MVFYRSLADSLANGWEGDRDTLPEGPTPEDRAPVAAERNTCPGRACPHYSSCSYYQARKKLAGVDVIVANHDLVLASIGARTLPELDYCLLVFDEAHHLPQKALGKFASKMDLTRLRWLDRVPAAVSSLAAELSSPVPAPIDKTIQELKAALSDMGALIWDNYSSAMRHSDGVLRLGDADISALLSEPLRMVASHSATVDQTLQGLNEDLRARLKEDPSSNARMTALYSVLGSIAPRGRGLHGP